MTTNKPDIQAFLMKQDGHYEPYVSIQRDSGCTGMVYPLVRLCDYEALQADRDQQYDMKVKAREQRDEVTTKLSALQAECEKLREQLESVKELLKDPITVFVHMKRGIIAKPSLRDLIDLHGDVPNGEDVQLLEITKHRSESERLRKLVEECADYLDHNEHTCIHNGSALHRKLADAIDAAMQEENK